MRQRTDANPASAHISRQAEATCKSLALPAMVLTAPCRGRAVLVLSAPPGRPSHHRPWRQGKTVETMFPLSNKPSINAAALTGAASDAAPQPAAACRRESSIDKPARYHRSNFLSDMHLGTRLSRADLILEFLRAHDAGTLCLVGDIVDNWYPLSRNWRTAHHDVLRRFLELPRTDTRVVYVPGNHDNFLRNYAGSNFGDIEVEMHVVHEGADGRRYLLAHCDSCDIFSLRAPLLARAGSLIERIAMGVDNVQRSVL